MSAAASARISSASGGTKHSTRSQATIAKALVAGENARPPPPHYRVFRCDWVDCGAELHNLETLKKHVYKVHMERVKRHCKWKGGQKTDPLAHDEPQSSKRRCGWKDCQKADSLELDELRSHFEQEHAYPYAMELGDGPSSIGHGTNLAFRSIDYNRTRLLIYSLVNRSLRVYQRQNCLKIIPT